ncbi:NB-ARC domain-containing protein [Streptomyces sp. NPDC002740]
MEALMSAVFSAVGTVTSGALSGAGGEMGRRASEGLYGLLHRARSVRDDADAGSERGDRSVPTLPVTESEQRTAVALLIEVARRSPGFARDLMEWAHNASWLAPDAVTAVARGASRPQLLPPTSAAFTDREDVTAAVTALLDEADRPPGAPAIAVLLGPAGIGKSAAVVHVARTLGERFPDGMLYVDLAGASASTALTPSEALGRLLDQLAVPTAVAPGNEARQRELYLDCTADRRLLVVLDDAHTDAQVIPLLPAAPGSLVLVTSRRRPERLVAGHGALPLALGPLSLADTVRLLTRLAGRERGLPEEAVVRAVAEGTGGIPLAVCTTGARLAVRRHLAWERVARQLSEQIQGGSEEVDEMTNGSPDVPADPVRLAHDSTYRELSPECASLYRAAAVWAWPTVTVKCAAHAADITEDRARELLEQLAAVHLLEEVDEERYRFHGIVRAHARDQAVAEDGHSRMAAAVRRIAVGYLRFAAQADFRVLPLRWRLGPAFSRLALPEHRDVDDGKRALAELRAERENLAAVVRAAAHHGFDDLVWQLCEAMWGLHLMLGFHAQWIDTHLLGVESARRSAAEFGDARAEGRLLVQLAFGYMGLGSAEEAERALAQAVSADEACGHHRGRASADEALGLLRLKQWRHQDAQLCFEEAREILGLIREGDDGWDDRRRAFALLEHHIGRAERLQRCFDAAVDRLNLALVEFRRLPGGGDRYNEGRVYMSLGETHLDAGAGELALVCLDKAVALMDTAGAELRLADAVELRARAHRLGDRPVQEAADLQTAVAYYAKGADSVGLSRVRARLSELGL